MFSKRRRQLRPGFGFGSDRTHNSLHEWSRVFRASQLASQPTGSGIGSTAVYYLRSPLRWEGRDTGNNLSLVPLPYNARPPRHWQLYVPVIRPPSSLMCSESTLRCLVPSIKTMPPFPVPPRLLRNVPISLYSACKAPYYATVRGFISLTHGLFVNLSNNSLFHVKGHLCRNNQYRWRYCGRGTQVFR